MLVENNIREVLKTCFNETKKRKAQRTGETACGTPEKKTYLSESEMSRWLLEKNK